MNNICIIPARGGSTRIPRKNIRPFCGTPIIAYPIRAALNSGIFQHVMVSTDDTEIADIAKQYGAEVPFMRSAETSNNTAIIRQVLDEVLGEYRKRGETFDIMCCMYATSCFVTEKKLLDAYQLMLDDETVPGVTPMVRYSYPPQRGYFIRNGHKVPMHPELRLVRTQDIEPLYYDAAQFYFHRMSAYDSMSSDYDAVVPIYSDMEVQDIDNEEDWAIAELKYRIMMGQTK